MLLLSLECSAVAASVALTDGPTLLAESFVNVKLTHSQTLMPMVESLLRSAALMLDKVEGFAVSSGPGSFTGVRIGVAAVKGMAQALGRPCTGVSTLEAMAWQGAGVTGCVPGGREMVLCPVMDARRGQVYNALFRANGPQPERLCEDRALALSDLAQELKNLKLCPFLIGDGAAMCYNELEQAGIDCFLAPEASRYQRAYGVALAAQERFLDHSAQEACDLQPTYLRLPQAERDLNQRNTQKEV